MIRQCAILFGCLALGGLAVYLTGIRLPAPILRLPGMPQQKRQTFVI